MTPALTSRPSAPSNLEAAPTDRELIRQFLGGSESAFTELVCRHIDLVYSAALRQVRDAHTASDVTSAVFIALARKAPGLGAETILPAWLHRATRYAALKALRAQARRRRYEEEAAHMQESLRSEESTAAWEEVAPLLDEGLTRLSARDHEAVALRFFQNKSHAEIARLVGGAEDAARKRVDRAVEKLRRFLTHRGVILSSALLLEAISRNAIRPAPPSLAESIKPPSAATIPAVSWGFLKPALATLLLATGLLIALKIPTNTSPRESFRLLTRAAESGDTERWSSFINVTTPEEKQLVPLLASNFVAQAELRRALIQRFGQRDYETSDFPRLLDDTPDNQISTATETINGTQAILHLSRGSDLRFVLVGNVWKFDFFRTTTQRPDQLRASLEQNISRLNTTLLRLKEDRYPTLRATALEFRTADPR